MCLSHITCVSHREDQGKQGPQGQPGADSTEDGDQGNPGPEGPPGAIGLPGKAGNIGTKGMKGEPGPKGTIGQKGKTGARGPTGAQGLTGPEGPQGKAGNCGPDGPPGTCGAVEAPGLAGPQGHKGARGPPGVMGPSGPAGPPGAGVPAAKSSFFASEHAVEDLNVDLPVGYNADKHMNTLLEKISSQQMSKGTRESPAMSCQDIYNCHGDSFKSGNYWIDPNEGSSKDAILVYCQGPETCVMPQQSAAEKITFENEVSLRFLKLKYINARQNIHL
ncbi:collagen alpha-1(II) chain-like [Dysidea avara]|uniref:collagen alpha-1(II) chain-like n=1 Tax=Dysidea avara TaxID=196820 RepID=UPI00332418EE